MSSEETKPNPFETAIKHIEDKHLREKGTPLSRAQIMVLLDCSHGWLYRCMRSGTTSLITAMKLEALTDGAVTWQELCPSKAAEVKSATNRITTQTA